MKRRELIYCFGGVLFLASVSTLAVIIFLSLMQMMRTSQVNLICAVGMLGTVTGNFLCSATEEKE